MEPKSTSTDNYDVHYLVFEGGGWRGLVFIGTLLALRDLGQLDHIKGAAGCSAGALTTLGVAFNYPLADLQKLMLNMQSDSLLDSNYSKLFYDVVSHPTDILKHGKNLVNALGKSLLGVLEGIASLPSNLSKGAKNIGRGLFLKQFALFKGEKTQESIYQFLRDALQNAIKTHPEIAKIFQPSNDPGKITFKQLHDIAKKYPDLHFVEELTITAVSLKTKKPVAFNHTTHGDMEIAVAARASMAIPFFFEPVEREGEHFVDGGVYNNYPVDSFDHDGANLHTLGIRVDTDKEIEQLLWQAASKIPKSSFTGSAIEAATGIKYSAAMQASARTTQERDGFRTLQMPDRKMGMLAFDASEKEKQALIDQGYLSTIAWFYLYRNEVIANLNPSNIATLTECLERLKAEYSAELTASAGNKTKFVCDYEICLEIQRTILAPPRPENNSTLEKTAAVSPEAGIYVHTGPRQH